jgi:hypothetical protein
VPLAALAGFNDVRNHRSLAHDNPILNHDEGLLIFSHVASSVSFTKALEDRIDKAQRRKESASSKHY